jgi:hypothetical protein
MLSVFDGQDYFLLSSSATYQKIKFDTVESLKKYLK